MRKNNINLCNFLSTNIYLRNKTTPKIIKLKNNGLDNTKNYYSSKNRNSIRSKYKNIKNIKNIYERQKIKVNTANFLEHQIKQIKVTKNESLFNKEEDNNSYKQPKNYNYLNNENDIDKQYLKYREMKNKQKRNNTTNYEETINRKTTSKYLYYKQLTNKTLFNEEKKEDNFKEKPIIQKEYMTPNDKKEFQKRNIFNSNYKYRINFGYNSNGNIARNNLNINNELNKKNKNVENDINNKNQNKNEDIKSGNLIKINIRNNYKKKKLENSDIINNKGLNNPIINIKYNIYKKI